MNRDFDPDQLMADNKYLRNENKHLRQALWDDFFKCSMIGVLGGRAFDLGGVSPTDFASNAAKLADAMMSVREERNGT